ncbi:MAG: MFS transporter [Campylobacterales bacterium]
MTYTQLLKSYPVFRRFWTMFLLMDFGAWFSVVAIYTLLTDFGASPFIIALVAALHWLPGALQAPVTGVVIDRVNVKKLMVVLVTIELVATLLFLTVREAALIGLLMALILVRMSAASFFFTAFQASLPRIVGRETALRRANELTSLTWSLTFILGMALGGVAVELWGTDVAFVLDSAVIAAALLLLLRIDLPKKAELAVAKASELLKEGFDYLKTHRKIVGYILLHATVGLTSFDALVTLLAQYNYAPEISIPIAIGAVNAMRAAGLFIGPFFFRRFQDEAKLIFWLLIGQGAAIFLWAGLQHDFYLSMIGLLATGFFTTSLWSATYSLILRHTDEAVLGRVVAYNDMTFLLFNAFTALLIGVMAGAGIELWVITAVLGGFFWVAAGLYKTRLAKG